MSSTSPQNYTETDRSNVAFSLRELPAATQGSESAGLPVDVTVHDAITVLQAETIEPQIIGEDYLLEIAAEEIAAEAYALYEARGCEHGHDVEDWLAAQALIRQRKISN